MVATKTTKKPEDKKTEAPKKTVAKKAGYTHIDRSMTIDTGALLKKSELDKERPWIGPVSRQATVEALTEEELKALKTIK